LLDLERVGVKRFLDAGEGGKVRVDRERTERRERREECREAPTEALRLDVGVDQWNAP